MKYLVQVPKNMNEREIQMYRQIDGNREIEKILKGVAREDTLQINFEFIK